MNSKNRWQLKLALLSSFFLKVLRRIIFKHSHLSPYLPIIKEELSDKVIRIYDDDAYAAKTEIADRSHHHNRQGKREEIFSNSALVSKECYNPIMPRLMVWYVFVFISIIFTYFVTGIALVYGLEAWQDLTTNPLIIALNLICIVVFAADIFVQLNTGFLFRGMIILDKERALSRYLRSYFVTDVFLVAILIA
jgi:fumarate reductase subunit C